AATLSEVAPPYPGQGPRSVVKSRSGRRRGRESGLRGVRPERARSECKSVGIPGVYHRGRNQVGSADPTGRQWFRAAFRSPVDRPVSPLLGGGLGDPHGRRRPPDAPAERAGEDRVLRSAPGTAPGAAGRVARGG